jgi:uncharacterized protein
MLIKKCIVDFNSKNSRIFISFSFVVFFLISVQGIYAVDDNSSTNSSLNQSSYSISYLDSSLGGDVNKNFEISQNIPKTDFSMQIFEMTKNGSVVLKFGNGNGPKLLISAGIHGNEPEANIATMKYLEYLKDKNFNGTIYLIPFDIPKDTAQNNRYYNGQDPNRIANIKGTPGWNIIKFARNNGINYLIDVHSGSSVESKGHIFVNSASTAEEKKWVSYIISQTGCFSGVDAADSPGMLRCAAHGYGINSITLEVERDSIPTIVAAETEFQLLMAAAKYLGFPGYTPYDSKPPTVTANPAGGSYTSAQTVTLTTVDPDSTATTYYTKDGSDPKSSVTRIIYTSPIQIAINTLLRYMAVDPDGNWSPNYSQTYTINLSANTVTFAQLGVAATSVKNYYETHLKTLPASVNINGKTLTMAQLLYLLVTGTININASNLNPITTKAVTPPPSPSGSIKSGNIQKTELINLAQSVQSFINTNGRAPNYKPTTLGNMPFKYIVYIYSKIIYYYSTTNRLPNYIAIAP